ncbi:Protein ecm33 [Zancudomyces culisetae]|uniref:Protein ecm33 n=1 Tax=Zancudomyces culisetae TaxID=1213189 RepID=A0A1R1PUS9_ZANCU|nr:Protein ecm33 [Zancudomyces culisetae]|eukprot:OMH84673.1 Protein ecm33 [Zancudomyces culisetae]
MYKGIVLALSTAAAVLGQCSSDITISDQSGVDAIGGCLKFKGSIKIDSFSGSSITLGSLQTVEGDIMVNNSFNLATISMSKLEAVSGKFYVENNIQAVGVNVPSLSSVGDFQLVNNPNLSTLTFRNLGAAKTFRLVQSSVSTLGALNFPQIQDLEFSDNSFLSSVTLPNLTEITGTVVLVNNKPDMVVKFPKLDSIAKQLTVMNAASMNMTSLSKTTGTLNFRNNDFDSLDFPGLGNVSIDIQIVGNNNLKDMSFPVLPSISGGLVIQDNPLITEIKDTYFSALNYVKGALIISGPISNITFPKLTRVDGAINITSTVDLDCNKVRAALASKGKSRFSCKAKASSGSDVSTDSSALSLTVKPTHLFGSLIIGALFAAVCAF